MGLKTFVMFMVLKISIASHPVIFQKDNSVIATESIKVLLPQHHNIIDVKYPNYEVVTNLASETLKADSLPADLIEIAATKLGIRNLNEIPSLSELGDLLGTTSSEETIETIRELTATESGIDLIKAFIESSDYTDHTVDKEAHVQAEVNTSKTSLVTILLTETARKDLDIIKNVLSSQQNDLGFFQRVSSFLNIFDLFPRNTKIAVPEVGRKSASNKS
ncbi:uncharacterized protein LOC129906505 isoform X1 [Episyrphus balteatus]|uniref:uncharacterized protein LOC129906505 isoform X1 n=1 Tax=Episyrphus balteatus TaxID=286459 RepID=UPI002486433F|nr:uncharacterized protein LOC129906505 isoform X1 [Episyrphus balteatus]XP_055838260.1 uncharacterized protein LOC129906505 isoform X1 [Episyrphus balteatus]XP_055838261.1 uncharacterized protein LOC129906505 isoform X1 [Episyrphus balteatus]